MSRPHQNVVMRVSKLDYTKVKKVSEILDTNEPKKGQFYLFLD